MKFTKPTVLRAAVSVLLWLAFSLNSVKADALTLLSEQEESAIRAHGPWPTPIPSDSGNSLSGKPWAEELGANLFFDATLSNQNQFSCASCHDPEQGFSDGRPVAIGAQRGVRNSQGLLDVGQQRWFGWDGGADSLWAASLRPMLAAHEMDNSVGNIARALRSNYQFVSTVLTHVSELPKRSNINTELQAAEVKSEAKSISFLNDEEVAVLAAKSIGAFVRTLRSERTPFDQYRDAVVNNDAEAQKDYPQSAERGLKLFLGEANCRACHFGPNFSNKEFHDTGRPFFTGVGQVDPGRYTGIKRVRSDPYNLLGIFAEEPSQSEKAKTANVKLSQGNWGQWRTPSLRNLKSTAPYMHDGSLATLRDVIDAYADIDPARLHASGEALLKPLQLDSQQRNDLVDFLLSLSPSD